MTRRDIHLRNFAFFSANLHQLLPELPYEQHLSAYREADRYGRLALDESLNRHWLQSDQLQHSFVPDLRQGGIISTFHTGPYRLLPMWLAWQGLPVTILVSAAIAESQQSRYAATRRFITRATGHAVTYECLIAEDPLILRKLLRALDRGHLIVSYLDGHTGTGTNHSTPSSPGAGTSQLLEFLGRPLRIRTGTAELARLSARPIYPMLLRFDAQDRPQLHTAPTISPPPPERNPAISLSIMQTLYQPLAESLRQVPLQWEGWYHLHHDLPSGRQQATGGLLRHYMPFRLGNHYYLLHKESLSVYLINLTEYQRWTKAIDFSEK